MTGSAPQPQWWGKLGLLLTLLLFAGCASAPQTSRLLSRPDGLSVRHELSTVAFFPQQRYQCGPAALATVLQATGLDITPEALVPEIYLPARHGSLQLEILATSRRYGRIPYPIQPDMATLLREINAGNPVLVLQNLGLDWIPRWHYAVAVGYDLEHREIVLRSGLEARHRTVMDTFERTWARSGYWGIVVLPSEQLPATAEVHRYLQAVVAMEDTGHWRIAQRAYRSTLQRWPDNLVARMGLGNTAYRLGESDTAARAFRAAIQAHPEAGAAHNNLAQVLLEQGKIAEARQHAQRAVELGGPRLTDFRATLTEIERQF